MDFLVKITKIERVQEGFVTYLEGRFEKQNVDRNSSTGPISLQELLNSMEDPQTRIAVRLVLREMPPDLLIENVFKVTLNKEGE